LKAKWLVIASIFLLTACTSKEYKIDMADGEKALSERKYEEAARAFATAIEEGPTDGKEAYHDMRYQLAIATLNELLDKHEGNFDIRPLVVEAKITFGQTN
jgi:major membrane immunogen (membrane-anchored lipoprotein)